MVRCVSYAFRKVVSRCFNLPPHRSDVSLSASTIETYPDRRKARSFDMEILARYSLLKSAENVDDESRGGPRQIRAAGEAKVMMLLAWFHSGLEILCSTKQLCGYSDCITTYPARNSVASFFCMCSCIGCVRISA